MSDKKKISKKGDFPLVPIKLSEPIKTTDGFTNLIEYVSKESAQTLTNEITEPNAAIVRSGNASSGKTSSKSEPAKQLKSDVVGGKPGDESQEGIENSYEPDGMTTETGRLSEAELLRILDAESLDEIYELSDVLRASSLKLYAALVGLADSRGRVRVKNHELMSQAGIKGIATLYKQERWLTDLKLVEKKAKPGPHDGSSYFIYKLESLPLPEEIYDKFADYLSGLK